MNVQEEQLIVQLEFYFNFLNVSGYYTNCYAYVQSSLIQFKMEHIH